MKYFAFFSGPEGCDYTVGCNTKLQELKANSKAEAEVEVKEIYRKMNPDYGIDVVVLFEVFSETLMDVSAIDAEIEQAKKEKEAADQLARDRAKFEELKRRFGE